MIIDFDSHAYEPRHLWERYADPGDRDQAIRIVDDALGYPMLQHKGVSPPGSFCWISKPGVRDEHGRMDPSPPMGEPQRRQRAGLPALERYEDMDPAYYDMRARRDRLPGWGVDEMIVYPQWGL